MLSISPRDRKINNDNNRRRNEEHEHETEKREKEKILCLLLLLFYQSRPLRSLTEGGRGRGCNNNPRRNRDSWHTNASPKSGTRRLLAGREDEEEGKNDRLENRRGADWLFFPSSSASCLRRRKATFFFFFTETINGSASLLGEENRCWGEDTR